MNIVRRHIILEKFSEDSDPIADMRIGMIKKIKDFFDVRRPYLKDNELIVGCSTYGKDIWLEYLLRKGAYIESTLEQALVEAIWYNTTKCISVLSNYMDFNKKIDCRILRSFPKNIEYPLIWSIYKGVSIPAILSLIKGGANINRINSSSWKKIKYERPPLYKKLKEIKDKQRLQTK